MAYAEKRGKGPQAWRVKYEPPLMVTRSEATRKLRGMPVQSAA
jgi:hypothetical protein